MCSLPLGDLGLLPTREQWELWGGLPPDIVTPEVEFQRRMELARQDRDAERRRRESVPRVSESARRWAELEAILVGFGEHLMAVHMAASADALAAARASEVAPTRKRRRWFEPRSAATPPPPADLPGFAAIPVGKGLQGTLYARFVGGRFASWHESWEAPDWGSKSSRDLSIDELVSPYEGKQMQRMNDRGRLEDVFPGQHSLDKRMAMTRKKVLDGFAAWAVEHEITP